MVYYNLKIITIPKVDIKYEETYEKLANLIALSMLADEELKKLHEKNQYKLYNYCSLYPFEKDGIYIAGKIYTFDIRFVKLEFATKMKQLLNIVNSNEFKIIMSNIETNEYKTIHKLISLTPAILTIQKGDYKIDDNIELVKERLIAGAEKKYKQIYGEELKADFIKNITKTNRTPAKLPYKNIFFLGNKFEIDINEDENSQKLAYVLLTTGILEKNSVGFRILQSKIKGM